MHDLPTPNRVASLFSGAGTFDYGFQQAGWESVFLCEYDQDAQKVLRTRFPAIPLVSDIRDVSGVDIPDCEVIMFGSPCQDLSIAGNRAGLAGERSGLFHEALRVIKEKRDATNGEYPRFALWENVPGALSSNGRRDFAAVLRAFLEIGATDIAWRILDAQHFGTPQRRRRIFLIADFGGGCAEQVLFEPESLRGDTTPRPAKGKDIAPTLTTRAGTRLNADEGLIVSFGPQNDHTPKYAAEVAQCMRSPSTGGTHAAVATMSFYESGYSKFSEGVGTLRASGGSIGGGSESYIVSSAVRRYTPTECERLQSLPDGWTDIGLSDTVRYRLCGNGGAAVVLSWIAKRLSMALGGK